MNIETVNELIRSLESAGELSIREQKFLKLAKAHVQLAAENVGLNSFIVDACWIVDDGQYCDATDFMPETPATDRIVAGIKADAITASLDACSDYLETDCVMDRLDISYEEAEKRTSGAIEFHDAMVDFANQVREGADK
ncbi:hypothetical protein [Klebsiella variicola]|uniref:hypothetical protein n=1 Tax=Klebsiella variicola TaxID=244366 RepID=UPI0019A08BD9|nr:hypothetical protein [Klebsiella variicola]MBD7736911.1 hypothetical protein [Klebsiella pneumoniae]WRP36394.1 hypothetical protein U1R81_20985 [Klebsiella variicola]